MDDSCNGNVSEEKQTKRDLIAENHIQSILQEKQKLSFDEYPLANRLLDEELKKTQTTKKVPFDNRYIDLYNDRLTKVVAKVMFPIKEHPNFNFVGKLLGPKGATLKTLQENTQCRILILGKGSMRDKAKEEELRTSGDTKYAHLSDELHVEVSCVAPPSEAHHRVGNALRELRPWLTPDPAADDGFGYGGEEVRSRGRPPYMGGNGNAQVMDFLEKARVAMEYQPPIPPRRPFPPQRGGGFSDGPRGGPVDNRGGTWVQGGFKRGGGAGGNGGGRKNFFPQRNNPY